MRILCLCPTYGRPKLVANALACFLAQDYPAHLRKLLILDDFGQFPKQSGDGWEVHSQTVRHHSLPNKYNAMLNDCGLLDGWEEGWVWVTKKPPFPWDAVAVWDDDDIYLPGHLSAAAKALAGGAPSCKPSDVWSLYRPDGATGDGPWREKAAGRFHCSLVISSERLRQIGGWVATKRADFDQQQISVCGPAADMLPHSGGCPTFVYRWGSTVVPHCSALMRSPSNEDWYDRYTPADTSPVAELVPKFDAETERVYRHLEGCGR